MTTKRYIDPVGSVLSAAKETQKLRKEVYSFALLQQVVEHNRTQLIPALKAAIAWAKHVEKETKQLEAKRRRARGTK